MQELWKRKGTGSWRFNYTDATGKIKEKSTKCKDKKAARLYQVAFLSQLTSARVKVPVPEMTVALAAFVADLERLGRTTNTVYQKRWAILRCLQGMAVERLQEVTGAKFEEFLAAKKADGNAANTLNNYLIHLSTFLAWCARRGYLPENPLSNIRPSKKQPKYPRRAFTREELRRLLEVAPVHRRNVYYLAAVSGLRRSELRQLCRQDFEMNPRSQWRLRPEITKAKRLDVVPMTPDAYQFMHKYNTHENGVPLLRPFWTREGWVEDIAKAGIAVTDAAGKRLVFHSLRYFFCAEMAKVLPIQQVKVLMRHASIRMTCDLYLQLGLDDLAEAMLQVPRLGLQD